VAGWLRKEENLSVSKSSIYNWIATGSPHQKDNIRRHLGHGGRKARHSPSGAKISIPNRISIDLRPVNADGQTPGDWEIDTILGKEGKGAIVTLVEKKSCFMLMEKLDAGKQAIPLAHTVVRLLKGTKMTVRTITTDNGTELAAHEIIARELNTSVNFAHPYSPWEKGAIENMNGLVRQYIPEKTDFKGISSGYIKQIIQKLNNRPRKKNDFSKPIDVIKQ
jgi:IS30 family transposase